MAQLGIRNTASVLAIAGGALFLVLPIAFFNGTTSTPVPTNTCPDYIYCLRYGPQPLSAGIVSFWTSLGVGLGAVGILLGCISLKFDTSRRVSLDLGHTLSLGLTTFLSWTVIWQIPGPLKIAPANLLLLPEFSVASMILATALHGYDLVEKARGGRGYDIMIYLRRVWA